MIKRNLGSYVLEIFNKYPVIAISGPRQSGKTTLCRALFPDKPYVNLEDLDVRSLAIEDPKGFLAQYPDGAIFDEFQRVHNLPSYLQVLVDADGRDGLFAFVLPYLKWSFRAKSSFNWDFCGKDCFNEISIC